MKAFNEFYKQNKNEITLKGIFIQINDRIDWDIENINQFDVVFGKDDEGNEFTGVATMRNGELEKIELIQPVKRSVINEINVKKLELHKEDERKFINFMLRLRAKGLEELNDFTTIALYNSYKKTQL
jgi:hypothetical protein